MVKEIGLIIILIAGLLLIGTGITGLAISETCCMPPNCDSEENICSNIENPTNLTQEAIKTFIGAIMIASSLWLYLDIKKKPKFQS